MKEVRYFLSTTSHKIDSVQIFLIILSLGTAAVMEALLSTKPTSARNFGTVCRPHFKVSYFKTQPRAADLRLLQRPCILRKYFSTFD